VWSGHVTTRGASRGLLAPRVSPPAKTGSRPSRGLRPAAPVREAGAVTAELAVVLPVLVAFVVALVWVVSLAAAQVRVVDAARESARAAARGDTDPIATARRVAPDDARIRVARHGDTVQAEVSAVVRGPGGLLAFLPGVTVHATSVATLESP